MEREEAKSPLVVRSVPTSSVFDRASGKSTRASSGVGSRSERKDGRDDGGKSSLSSTGRSRSLAASRRRVPDVAAGAAGRLGSRAVAGGLGDAAPMKEEEEREERKSVLISGRGDLEGFSGPLDSTHFLPESQNHPVLGQEEPEGGWSLEESPVVQQNPPPLALVHQNCFEVEQSDPVSDLRIAKGDKKGRSGSDEKKRRRRRPNGSTHSKVSEAQAKRSENQL